MTDLAPKGFAMEAEYFMPGRINVNLQTFLEKVPNMPGKKEYFDLSGSVLPNAAIIDNCVHGAIHALFNRSNC